MKVAELKGIHLDYWVAKTEDRPLSCDWNQGEYILVGYGHGDLEQFSPSTDPCDGHPIIERERISTVFNVDQWIAGTSASIGPGGHLEWNFLATGETMLIAAMRAFVASKLGEELP